MIPVTLLQHCITLQPHAVLDEEGLTYDIDLNTSCRLNASVPVCSLNLVSSSSSASPAVSSTFPANSSAASPYARSLCTPSASRSIENSISAPWCFTSLRAWVMISWRSDWVTLKAVSSGRRKSGELVERSRETLGLRERSDCQDLCSLLSLDEYACQNRLVSLCGSRRRGTREMRQSICPFIYAENRR